MSKKPNPPKRETTQFIEDEIFKERIRKENMNQVDYEVFQPSLDSLREATPDKPGIDSFCSRLYSQSKTKAIDDDDDDSPEFQTFKHTMFMTSRDVSPQQKYSEPLTTTMEIGWEQTDYKPFKSMFDHRHKKTDITSLPSKWDPNANVMTVKSKPK